VADGSDSIKKEDLVQPLTALGYYWHVLNNHPRAIARFKRAIEIDVRALLAYRGLCETLYHLARRAPRETVKAQLLGEAENACRRALEIAPEDSDTFYDLGWVFDERDDFAEAAKAYREAQRLSDGAAKTAAAATYNLACTLSRWGTEHLAESLTELKKVIELDEDYRAVAARDKDFQNLRNDPRLGPSFSTLVTPDAQAGHQNDARQLET
jgi:tetratricopeptide (TPR) repeat protein